MSHRIGDKIVQRVQQFRRSLHHWLPGGGRGARAQATKEALWLHKIGHDLKLPMDTVTIYGDNQSALKLLRNPISSARSQHIDVAYHFTRERVARKEIGFEYVCTDNMVADSLTKALPEAKHHKCTELMGIN